MISSFKFQHSLAPSSLASFVIHLSCSILGNRNMFLLNTMYVLFGLFFVRGGILVTNSTSFKWTWKDISKFYHEVTIYANPSTWYWTLFMPATGMSC